MIEITVLVSAAVAGFLGSGHCVLMCGAISESLNRACGARCGGSWLRNISRVAGYGLMGAMVGGLGQGALSTARALALRDYAQLLSGVMLVVIASTMLVNREAFARLEKPGRKLIPLLLKLRSKLPNKGGFARDVAGGLLWSLMPCGMVYAALLSAWFSVSAVQGGLIMMSFGLGTMPAMLGLSVVLSVLKRRTTLAKISALLLLCLGLVSLAFASGLIDRTMGRSFGPDCVPSFSFFIWK
jgi:uncharacterized protein